MSTTEGPSAARRGSESNDLLGHVAEANGLVWAPADGVQMLLERAASMLTGYGELIRRDGASHIEEHHYLPEVEHVATELREACDEITRRRNESEVMRAWITAALAPLQAIADLEDFEDGDEGLNALIAAGRRLGA